MSNLTKKAIKTSFLKLLNEYPLSKISVRSIVEDCGINRNSFYYHYSDIPALIDEIIREEVDALISKYPSVNTLDECIHIAFAFSLENKKAVMHTYNSVNRDIYESSLMKICEYAVTSYLDTAFGRNNVSEHSRTLAIRFIKCGLFGLVYEWVSTGMNDDAITDIEYAANILHGLSADIIERIRENE